MDTLTLVTFDGIELRSHYPNVKFQSQDQSLVES